MDEVKPKQANDCLFKAAERDLLVSLHGVMAQAVKSKSKYERA